MMWFLVILFPLLGSEEFAIKAGWYPIPYASEVVCNQREETLENYFSDIDMTAKVSCIAASDRTLAIEEAMGEWNF